MRILRSERRRSNGSNGWCGIRFTHFRRPASIGKQTAFVVRWSGDNSKRVAREELNPARKLARRGSVLRSTARLFVQLHPMLCGAHGAIAWHGGRIPFGTNPRWEGLARRSQLLVFTPPSALMRRLLVGTVLGNAVTQGRAALMQRHAAAKGWRRRDVTVPRTAPSQTQRKGNPRQSSLSGSLLRLLFGTPPFGCGNGKLDLRIVPVHIHQMSLAVMEAPLVTWVPCPVLSSGQDNPQRGIRPNSAWAAGSRIIARAPEEGSLSRERS